MTGFVLVLSLLILPESRGTALASSSSHLVLALMPELESGASKRVLRLRDFAQPVVDRDHVWPLVRDTVVLPDGGREYVTWGQVLHRLAGAGLPADRVELNGPALCVLQRKATP